MLRSTMRHQSVLVIGLTAALVASAVSACGNGEHHGPGSSHSLLDRLNNENDTAVDTRLSSASWLHGRSYAPMEGIELDGVEPFYVEERTGAIQKFPCTECHSVPLATLKSESPEKPDAHWGLVLNHASASVMECTTCHTSTNMDSLHLLEGESVDLNSSYRVCAQCHSTQTADWVGGAHGKRLGGWESPRVVANCTACHDPHDPAWDIRFPARASRVAVE